MHDCRYAYCTETADKFENNDEVRQTTCHCISINALLASMISSNYLNFSLLQTTFMVPHQWEYEDEKKFLQTA